MKNGKKILFIILGIVVFAIVVFAISRFFITDDNNSVSGTRTSDEITLSNNVNTEYEENRISSIIENAKVEENTISTFATTIKDNAAGRLANIRITCNTLNGTIVKPGTIFSFGETVGPATAEKGYQEAKIIVDHHTETGLGGGNCQVSSTLYNAVLAVPTLAVTERHEHGKDVTYVPEGKDAAVSYGSLDLKFRNDGESDIRIDATTDDTTITITLVELK